MYNELHDYFTYEGGERVQEQLRELEQEIGAPIRLLDGRGTRSYVAPEWTQTHIRGSGFSVEDGTERGVTVAFWATAAPSASAQLISTWDAALIEDYDEDEHW